MLNKTLSFMVHSIFDKSSFGLNSNESVSVIKSDKNTVINKSTVTFIIYFSITLNLPIEVYYYKNGKS